MCGIVGAVASRDIVSVLLAGLRALEYRGYDSAGLCVPVNGELTRLRTAGKVSALQTLQDEAKLASPIGIAHTRWATHGAPSTRNAHPVSAGSIAVVHNGIIENHQALRAELGDVEFLTDTDTEVVAHLIRRERDSGKSLVKAVLATLKRLEGAYALGVMDLNDPDTIVGARLGSPLVVGLGFGENFIASDVHALLPVTNRFIYLQEGDTVAIERERISIYGRDGERVRREMKESDLSAGAVDRGPYRHFMQKEIFEQPAVVAETLEGRLIGESARVVLGANIEALLEKARNVHIVACGTSYHAGLVARHWIESIAGLPCNAEVASEYRYRQPVVQEGTLLLTISQSGETADTLAALRQTQNDPRYCGRLALCNVPESSLVRESEASLMTRAGPEIGVASTKAFTTQLTALALLTLTMARTRGADADELARRAAELRRLPAALDRALSLDGRIDELAQRYANKHHALFLGRGVQFPVAMEGSLKLKEISYIHAEAYPAGELKHGPLALVDEDMPVIAVAPSDRLLEKIKSNLAEVRARGGQLHVFADAKSVHDLGNIDGEVITVDDVSDFIAPIVMTVPLQLLAYHVAVLKGTDVDQPRNLAKSVTVE